MPGMVAPINNMIRTIKPGKDCKAKTQKASNWIFLILIKNIPNTIHIYNNIIIHNII